MIIKREEMDEDSYKAPNQRNKIGKKGSKQNTEHIKIDLEFIFVVPT